MNRKKINGINVPSINSCPPKEGYRIHIETNDNIDLEQR
jgi:hypothetical protein